MSIKACFDVSGRIYVPQCYDLNVSGTIVSHTSVSLKSYILYILS